MPSLIVSVPSVVAHKCNPESRGPGVTEQFILDRPAMLWTVIWTDGTTVDGLTGEQVVPLWGSPLVAAIGPSGDGEPVALDAEVRLV